MRITIKEDSTKSFTLKLKPLGIGNFPIKITATSLKVNAQDSVQKLLFVKVIIVCYHPI